MKHKDNRKTFYLDNPCDKYDGEFVCSYFAWVSPEFQKTNAKDLENMTNPESISNTEKDNQDYNLNKK